GLAGTEQNFLDPEALKERVSENWGSSSNIRSLALKHACSSGTALRVLGMNLLLIPVIMFYLLRDWDKLLHWIEEQLPRDQRSTIIELAGETNSVLGQFIRGQLSVMSILGLIYVVGLWLMGLDLALGIGVLAGLISFVPYLGVIVGLLLSGIAALVQTGDAFQLIWVGLIFGIGQIMETMVLQLLLLGGAITLQPVWVVLGVVGAGQVFAYVLVV